MESPTLEIKRNISLKNYTTFKIGGKAKYFSEISNLDQLKEALFWAKKKKLPFFILGNGSNVLVRDEGYNGLIIKIKNNFIKETKNSLIVGAGYLLTDLVQYTIKKGIKNYEWLNGIPGTVGGAIYGNAGAFGFEMKDLVLKVKTIDPDGLKEKVYNNNDCQFNYRSSIFKTRKEIIWEAELKKVKGDKKEIAKKSLECLKTKIEKKMFFYPSAGSIFKNVLIENTPYKKYFDPEKEEVIINGEKVKALQGKVSTGWFIDKCGLKGKVKGGAKISDFHANVIINFNKAKAKDVLYLINLIKREVFKKFKIKLEEEIEIV